WNSRAVEQIGDVVAQLLKLGVFVVKLGVECIQFFIGRLKFFFRCLQFLVGTLQLLVGRENFLIRGLELLLHGLLGLNGRTQCLLCLGELPRQPLQFEFVCFVRGVALHSASRCTVGGSL